VDPKKDLQRPEGEDRASEQETQNPQRPEVESTPMGQTDIEQDERGDTRPGD
jgi:hypothetical protein